MNKSVREELNKRRMNTSNFCEKQTFDCLFLLKKNNNYKKVIDITIVCLLYYVLFFIVISFLLYYQYNFVWVKPRNMNLYE